MEPKPRWFIPAAKGWSDMSELRKITAQDQGERFDEAAAAQLACDVLEAQSAAPRLVLHPDGPELLDVHQDDRAIYIEHWLIMGVWLTTIVVALWRFLL